MYHVFSRVYQKSMIKFVISFILTTSRMLSPPVILGPVVEVSVNGQVNLVRVQRDTLLLLTGCVRGVTRSRVEINQRIKFIIGDLGGPI